MRYDKNRLLLMAVIVLLVIVLAVLVIVALVGMDSRNPTPKPDNTTAPTNSTQTVEDLVIETPYCDIVFPGKFADYLKVERTENPDLLLEFIAEFDSGKSQKLFSIGFGAAADPAVGQLVTADGVAVGVYVATYEFDPDGTWRVKETKAVTEMQEALNDVLAGLNLAPLGTPVPEVQGDELVVETPYGNLYFPSKWAEELKITIDESDGYDVVFSGVIGSHDAVPLFIVNFGGSQGTVVHTMYTENDVPFFVRLRTVALDIEDWSAVDQTTARTMQEDLNYLLAKLRGE